MLASGGGTVVGAAASGDEQGGALNGFSGLIALIQGDDPAVLSGGGGDTDVDVTSGVEGTTGCGWAGDGVGGGEADPVQEAPTSQSRIVRPIYSSGAYRVACASVSATQMQRRGFARNIFGH